MKKVLLVATVQSHIAQFHKPLADILHANGCEIHVAARDNLAEKNGLKIDFADKIYNVPFARSPKNPQNIKAYQALKGILSRERYDVIHCNTPMGGIIARLAARKYRNNGTKVYYTAHGFHFYHGAPLKNWLLFYPVEKLFSQITDKLITITHEDYKLASKKFYCQVAHIHGVGVDDNRFHPVSQIEKNKLRTELGFGKEQKLILCVGELLPNKNQTMAIKMMGIVRQEYPDALLLLAGNGPQKEDLERLIVKMDLQKNIRMLGYCNYLEKYQQAADVLVSCSKREGLPLNIVEAMLSGKPVVATQNRGHRELIHDNKNGYLVNVDDTAAMAEFVLSLLKDEIESGKIGADACSIAKEYNILNVKRELEAIYFG